MATSETFRCPVYRLALTPRACLGRQVGERDRAGAHPRCGDCPTGRAVAAALGVAFGEVRDGQ